MTQSLIKSQRDSHILDSTLHYNGVNDRLLTESTDNGNVHELGLTGGEKRKVQGIKLLLARIDQPTNRESSITDTQTEVTLNMFNDG